MLMRKFANSCMVHLEKNFCIVIPARLQALLLGLEHGGPGTGVQDDLCDPLENGLPLHVQRVDLRHDSVEVPTDLAGLRVEFQLVGQLCYGGVDFIELHGCTSSFHAAACIRIPLCGRSGRK